MAFSLTEQLPASAPVVAVLQLLGLRLAPAAGGLKVNSVDTSPCTLSKASRAVTVTVCASKPSACRVPGLMVISVLAATAGPATNCATSGLPTGTPAALPSTVNQPASVELSVTEQLPACAPLVAVVQLPALKAVHWFAAFAFTNGLFERAPNVRVAPPSRQENAKVCGCQVFRLPLLSYAVAVMVYESTPLAILVAPVKVMLTRD